MCDSIYMLNNYIWYTCGHQVPSCLVLQLRLVAAIDAEKIVVKKLWLRSDLSKWSTPTCFTRSLSLFIVYIPSSLHMCLPHNISGAQFAFLWSPDTGHNFEWMMPFYMHACWPILSHQGWWLSILLLQGVGQRLERGHNWSQRFQSGEKVTQEIQTIKEKSC